MEPEHIADPAGDGLRKTLDAVDRSQWRYRALLGLAIAGCAGLALWFERSLQGSMTQPAAALERGVALIVAVIALTAVRLQQSVRKQTQLILRAIAERERKS